MIDLLIIDVEYTEDNKDAILPIYHINIVFNDCNILKIHNVSIDDH